MDATSASSAESACSSGGSSHDYCSSSSSATPPSTGLSSPATTFISHRDAALSKEAAEFLSDLGNYLALGSISLEDFAIPDANLDTTTTWQDVTQSFSIVSAASLTDDLSRLAAAGWVRIQCGRSILDHRYVILRIYVLPGDVGHRFIDRHQKRLFVALKDLLRDIDTSPETWQGRYSPTTATRFDMWATKDDGSLFYMFNKLRSPHPSPSTIGEKYAHEALEDLLDPASVLPGLRTRLYPYQRRSAGLMLQRESVAKLELDPRLERRTAPDGSSFYYGARDLQFFRHPRFYEACRGGILAETMGLGKTVICLSAILATKHHLPRIPPTYDLPKVRPAVGSLADMAVSAINRKSVPWRVEFERIRHARGEVMVSCIEKLELSPPCYEIPIEPARWNRKTTVPPPQKMKLASTTLIVVPRNLCKQWQSEIKKHLDEDALSVLVMEDIKQALPPPDELRTYDIVLFSRNRFEIEIKDGEDEQGRRLSHTQPICRCPYIGATRTRDCRCVRTDDLYESPLKHLHFKRLIIDEGHFFSTTNTTAVAVANKLVKADHRWVVSGTPAKDLLGVEVDISVAENLWQTPDTKECRDAVLEQRRTFSVKEDSNGAIKSLGNLASNFLKIKPWYAQESSERPAVWDEYIFRHEDLRRRTFSGFSSCLRRTLEAVVVKTQPEDVERDIELPPFSHEVVRLKPSYFDKLTANLFTLVLMANAVTSERTDADYLFHKNGQKARHHLIANLRQSAFFWTGFSEADVLASVENSERYLAKEGTSCTEEDRRLLTETVAFADTYLNSAGWKSLSRSHELGLFVDDWPAESAEFWSFDDSRQPLLTGVSQLLEAQKHVNGRMHLRHDLGEGLAGEGIRATAEARGVSIKQEEDQHQKGESPVLNKSGIPMSSLDGEPLLKRRASSLSGKGVKLSFSKVTSPRKTKPASRRVTKPRIKRMIVKEVSPHLMAEANRAFADLSSNFETFAKRTSPQQHGKQSLPCMSGPADPPRESRYTRSRIVGTTSAKLSYLASQILKYYQHEKILVFYEGDNVAYYIAQMLELLHIKHEIYAKSLAAALKSEYVVRFDQEAHDRVLLMDVKQAAFGLNLSSASRIYFVNPVCRPNIEAQAIKRAHRIGQTRKVFVETLVLQGTIEEKMLERAKRMTRSEHLDAKALEDDGGMREIIQSARVLPVAEHEKVGYGQMAPLEDPQQLWGRPGWQESMAGVAARSNHRKRRKSTLNDVTHHDSELRVDDGGDPLACKIKKRRVLSFVDITNPADFERLVEGDEDGRSDADSEPVLQEWRRRRLSAASTATTSAGPSAGSPGLRSNRNPTLTLPPMKCDTMDRIEARDAMNHEPERLPGDAHNDSYRKIAISQLLNDAW